mmetsp:Transcript_52150/g.134517  ORF Transcript_52150/g.134517 Transcript_52150/m.134517 type:complete len:465 (+) Transcript_52150:255-1649(+)
MRGQMGAARRSPRCQCCGVGIRARRAVPCSRSSRSPGLRQRRRTPGCRFHKELFPLGVPSMLADFPGPIIKGVKYPGFFKESEVIAMQEGFTARAGDVIVVSVFPIWGIQRILVALVEGRTDPWAADLLDKPYFMDAAASKRGASEWIQEASSWAGRRCLKTCAMPRNIPCRYPFEQSSGSKFDPKIVVLLADPRHYVTMFWGGFKRCFDMDLPYTTFLEQFLESKGSMLPMGSWVEHSVAWSQEAQKYPDTVRLFNADRLGSLDPKEFMRELSQIAEFIGVDNEAVHRLTGAAFRRPMLIEDPDSSTVESLSLQDAVRSGHLVEQSARNLYMFEDTLSEMSSSMAELWKGMLAQALQSSNPCVIHMVQAASKGVFSLPPMAMTEVFKGELAHNEGRCRPCVFALRGVCKDTVELCRFCHDPSHPRTKRAPRSKRTARKALQRIRTPSPGSPREFFNQGTPSHR